MRLLLLISTVSATVELTESTFESSISGKAAFVKFFAPWCGHCKAMKADWDSLAEEFASSPKVLIADVDCTVEEGLCGTYGVEGFPTIKYFTSETGSNGETYEGGRDLDSLRQFAEETLGGACDVKTLEGCDEKASAYITKMKERGQEAMEKEHARLVGMALANMAEEKVEWLLRRLKLLQAIAGIPPPPPEKLPQKAPPADEEGPYGKGKGGPYGGKGGPYGGKGGPYGGKGGDPYGAGDSPYGEGDEEEEEVSSCMVDGTDCDEKEVKYIEKIKAKDEAGMKKEYERLEGMSVDAGGEAGVWIKKRMRIISQLTEEDGETEVDDEV